MFNVTLNSSWLKINWSQLKIFSSKLNWIEKKKPQHFSYTIEYPYPPTNNVWFPHYERLSQLYCALFTSVFCVLNLTAWDHLGVGMKNSNGYQKTQNFTLISNPFKKFLQNAQKIFLAKMWRKYALFTFTHVRQTCFDFNVFWCIKKNTFLADLKSAWNSAFLIFTLWS